MKNYYISLAFNKLAVHITKNYLDLPQLKVPLILGIHGRKGEGKTFQCELVFQRMGVEVVHISGGELESPDAGDPARLIRLRYREAAELVRVRGCMAVLMINDLDAGAGRFDRMTQYTVNTQLVNNTLMNIADNPTNVQLPGSYDDKPLPRIPIIATGNDFATLYAPLIRDGRMQKFYWEPSETDRLGIVGGMFAADGLSAAEVETLVKTFHDQAIDFFGAVRSQIYDEQITQFIHSVGIQNVASKVVNTVEMPAFAQPNFDLAHLIDVGKSLVAEQTRVRTMGLVSEYNQAVTPAGRPMRDRQYDRTALLTPPVPTPISPYPQPAGASNGQSNTEEVSPRSFKEMAKDRAKEKLSRRDQRVFQARSQQNTDNGFSHRLSGPRLSEPQSNLRSSNPLSVTLQQQLDSMLAAGHRLGIEYADPRRFRTNSWQCYTVLNVPNKSEAASALSACLSEFPNHYIRLVEIDPVAKQRLAETIVQRP